MTSVVVDTNVLISFLQNEGDSAQVLGRFDRLVIPFAVDAEFRAGLDLTTQSGRHHMQILETFLADPSVEYAAADSDISQKYAMVYQVLRKQGTPIPVNDIWIASVALVRNTPVCTFDRHFRHVPLLDVIELPYLC
jgi:tRNA(fMet)-specific endonuclease VapC